MIIGIPIYSEPESLKISFFALMLSPENCEVAWWGRGLHLQIICQPIEKKKKEREKMMMTPRGNYSRHEKW